MPCHEHPPGRAISVAESHKIAPRATRVYSARRGPMRFARSGHEVQGFKHLRTHVPKGTTNPQAAYTLT